MILVITLLIIPSYSQDLLEVEGVVFVLDEFDFTIPYCSISIPAKGLGTSSNEDGKFSLVISEFFLLDTLEVSSIGFFTKKNN